MKVPYFRPQVGEEEVAEVSEVLRSGWLTSGPRAARFETEFKDAVGAEHAIAVNSCTAGLHLAVDALGLAPGDGVLVPSMTFAATAEVVRYQGAFPILVDCVAETQQLDLADAERKVGMLRRGELPLPKDTKLVGIIPVHVGGAMLDINAVNAFARTHDLWVVEDAAHAFPAARKRAGEWVRCGQGTSSATCFSFYANKTITTGEGGMVLTNDAALASRMRLMCLHGLSHDAWERYSGGRSWDYRIIAPGYKYNLTDIAAAVGIHQLARAEQMRKEREAIAHTYRDAFADEQGFELPVFDAALLHSWHLFPIRLRLDRIRGDRNAFVDALKDGGVGCSVHWRPLHAHPYYEELGWSADHCPVAEATWLRLVSLPIFPGLSREEIQHVVKTVKQVGAVQ